MFIPLEIFLFRFIVGPRIRNHGHRSTTPIRLAHKASANRSATLTTTKIVGRVTVIQRSVLCTRPSEPFARWQTMPTSTVTLHLAYSVFAYSVFAYSVFAYSVFAYPVLAYSVLTYSLTFPCLPIPCSPIPYSPIPCSPIPCSPIPCSPIPYCLFRVRRLQPNSE